MTLRKPGSAREVARQRDRMLADAEGRVEEATDAAMRKFLRRVQERIAPDALTAALADDFPASRDLFEIGEAQGWWEDAVDEHVVSEVQAVWRSGYFDTRDGELVDSSLQAAQDHLANVTDRLSRTATPTIPERAMDTARVALSDEMARGSSTRDISRRLAAEFSWDEDATYWRDRLAEADRRVDELLDPIGDPGHPAREAMRRSDPDVARLQAERAEARKHIDRVESEWQTRSERIARTETAGAYNAGALDAGRVEEAGVKVWIATSDDRTRDDHLDTSGQCVPTAEPFDVGGDELQMPADPSGPARQTINCRCTVVFADSCAEADELYGDVDEVMDEERERRGDVEDRAQDPELAELDQGQQQIVERLGESDDAAGTLTDEDLDRLPQRQAFDLPDGIGAMGNRQGPSVGYVDNRRLYAIERATIAPDADFTITDALRAARNLTEGAHPGGVESPLKTLVYSAGPHAAAERRFGFGVAGLADRRSIGVYSRSGSRTLDDLLDVGTVRHEVGHSLAHAGNQTAVRRAADLIEDRPRIYGSVADDAPEWFADTFGGREELRRLILDLGDDANPMKWTGPEIVEMAGHRAADLETARREATRFVRARNRKVRQITEPLEELAAASHLDARRLGREAADYREHGIASGGHVPARRFQDAAESDAQRLERFRNPRRAGVEDVAERFRVRDEWNAIRPDRTAWDDAVATNHRIALDGRADFHGRGSRPAVTEYAASVDHGVEDWAEAWRLYTHDRIHGGLGERREGGRVRFADLWPGRAKAIEDWADTLGFDLDDIGRP